MSRSSNHHHYNKSDDCNVKDVYSVIDSGDNDKDSNMPNGNDEFDEDNVMKMDNDNTK